MPVRLTCGEDSGERDGKDVREVSSESPDGRLRSVEVVFVEDCLRRLLRRTISLDRLDEPEEFEVEAALFSGGSFPLSSMAVRRGQDAHLMWKKRCTSMRANARLSAPGQVKQA